MQQLNDIFFDIVDEHLVLVDKHVLEVGCGHGDKTVELAKRCASVVGIDPDQVAIAKAQERAVPNATFKLGVGEKLDFANHTFDAVFFTNSFHHIPANLWTTALDETIRVLRPDGQMVFYELGEGATEDEVDLLFWTESEQCDRTAARFLLANTMIHITSDVPYTKTYQYDSVQDFKDHFKPTRNLDMVETFLRDHDYHFTANRRILIAQPAV